MNDKKLSLNIKLTESNLKNKIENLLKKNSNKVESSQFDRNTREQNTLTYQEKIRRVKALLHVKSEQKHKVDIEKQENKPPIKDNNIINNQSDKRQNITANNIKKDQTSKLDKNTSQEHYKKKNLDKKNTINKRIFKHSKLIIQDDDKNFIVAKKKSHLSIPKKIEKKKQVRKVKITGPMTVHDISTRILESRDVIIKLIKGLDSSIDVNSAIDADIVELIVQELGHISQRITDKKIQHLIDDENEDPEGSLKYRPPVITIMGHVDHGKTTLIDALRESNITDTEYGGITQHIGAYQIETENNHLITFIDTPGHEAFTAMRARGAQITDIVILVIAADDSIKAQTIEAINHIKAAKVPVIIAINKIDKAGANIAKVTNDLLQYDIIPEEYGGNTMIVPISARNKVNLDHLKEAILLQASFLELKANPNKNAKGVILEGELDKKRGVIATIIIESGTLKKGEIIVAGETYCKVKAMINCHGKSVKEALPATPVKILGFESIPNNGDKFFTIKRERDAKFITNIKETTFAQLDKSQVDVNELLNENEKKQINFIIKSDTQGSIEAIINYINKLQHGDIEVKILHKAVGIVTESDILLAAASQAIIIAFCVHQDKKISELAKQHNVCVNHYSIIYNLIDSIKDMLSGLLPTIKEEKILGRAVIREIFDVSKTGKIAGCYVQNGLIKNNSCVRLFRKKDMLYEGKISTLRRFKDEAKEVSNGYECGIALEKYSDIQVNDILESFEIIEITQKL